MAIRALATPHVSEGAYDPRPWRKTSMGLTDRNEFPKQLRQCFCELQHC